MVATLFCLTFLIPAASVIAQFKTHAEAESTFEAMYGGALEAEESPEIATQDEYGSIHKFVEAIAKNKSDSVYIVYGSRAQLDAASLLRSFLGRKRDFPLERADMDETKVFVVDQKKMDPAIVNRAKAIFLGSPSDNKYIQSMEKSGKLTTSRTKAQFRLFRSPNCLAIACRENKMFVEMVRVLVRSHQDFEEAIYSYFYLH